MLILLVNIIRGVSLLSSCRRRAVSMLIRKDKASCLVWIPPFGGMTES